MPIQLLSSICADLRVVPEPQKQFKTMLEGLEEVVMIKSKSSAFFPLDILDIGVL